MLDIFRLDVTLLLSQLLVTLVGGDICKMNRSSRIMQCCVKNQVEEGCLWSCHPNKICWSRGETKTLVCEFRYVHIRESCTKKDPELLYRADLDFLKQGTTNQDNVSTTKSPKVHHLPSSTVAVTSSLMVVTSLLMLVTSLCLVELPLTISD